LSPLRGSSLLIAPANLRQSPPAFFWRNLGNNRLYDYRHFSLLPLAKLRRAYFDNPASLNNHDLFYSGGHKAHYTPAPTIFHPKLVPSLLASAPEGSTIADCDGHFVHRFLIDLQQGCP
jgi:hypothetical protein